MRFQRSEKSHLAVCSAQKNENGESRLEFLGVWGEFFKNPPTKNVPVQIILRSLSASSKLSGSDASNVTVSPVMGCVRVSLSA